MRRWFRMTPILIAFCIAVPTTQVLAQGTTSTKPQATAKVGWQGWGVRVGASSNPDQVYGGVHFNLGEFAPNVRFRPTAEIGFGDDVTLVQALAEVHYVFSKVQVWKPYAGGGVGLTYVNWNDNDHSGSDTEFSVAALGGVETKLKSGNSFMMELKFGLGDDDPDVKFGVGWSFK